MRATVDLENRIHNLVVAPRAAKRLTRQAHGGSRPGVCDRRRTAAGRSATAAECRRDEVMNPVLVFGER